VNQQQEAFHLARRAAELDFDFAMQGLLAGHQAAMQKMRDALTQKDVAFLMALALTERGARLDKSGIMASKIAEGLKSQVSLCKTESDFIARAEST
jgi:hypothetical protein